MRIMSSVILFGALSTLELPAQRVASPTEKTPSPAATGAPPTALAVSGTPSTAALSWQAPVGATGFDVHRALAPNGNWVRLTPAPMTVTKFTDGSGFSFGQSYLYRVVSLFADGSYGRADVSFQPPAPQNPAWVKAIQQGSNVVVSWAPVAGATRFKILGGQAGQSNREVAAPGTSTTYLNVAPGGYQWSVGASFDPGPVETGAIQWPSAILNVVAASARYRVIITGLSVLRESQDDPFHNDGMNDEVFVAAQAIVFNRRTGAEVGRQVTKSMSYGDTYNPPRVQAGSAGPHGGLIGGDNVPVGDPTQPSPPATSGRIPLVAFDGTLTDGLDEVLIFPSIWEVDHGNGTLYNDWLTRVPNMRPSSVLAPSQNTGSALPVYRATDELQYSAQSGAFNCCIDHIRLDRPIGSELGKTTGLQPFLVTTYHYWQPVFRLSREELESRLTTPFVAKNGWTGVALSIEFKEVDQSYLRGHYVLHLWIARV